MFKCFSSCKLLFVNTVKTFTCACFYDNCDQAAATSSACAVARQALSFWRPSCRKAISLPFFLSWSYTDSIPSVASSSVLFLLWQILAPSSLCSGFNLHSILYSQLSSHSHLFSLYLSHLCSYSCFNSIFDATLLYMPKYHSMLCLSLLCSVQNNEYHITCRWSAGSYF